MSGILSGKNNIAIPPGETIKEILKDRGISQKELAFRTDYTQKHICRLLNGLVLLTPQVASALEYALNIKASFWLNLEAMYRSDLAKVENENDLEDEKQILSKIPYNQMAEYGYVDVAKSSETKIVNIRKFFGISNLKALMNSEFLNLVFKNQVVAFRKANRDDSSNFSILAWIQKVKTCAASIEVKKFSKCNLKKNIKSLVQLANSSDSTSLEEINSFFSSHGIAFVYLPHLNGSGLSGVSFIDNKKIVVGVSDLGKTLDKFWFNLFHELAHILLGHLTLETLSSEQEKEANLLASSMLIDKEEFDIFLSKHSFNEKDIIEFSKKIGIHPGIVVGRLQYEKLIAFSSFNKLKENIHFNYKTFSPNIEN